MDILWKFAKELNIGQVSNESFVAIPKIKNVGLSKLTQLMFICKPETFISLDLKQAYVVAKNCF